MNANKILGGLLRRGVRRGISGNRAAIGIGLLGVAIAAYEHFTQQRRTVSATGPPYPSTVPPPPPPPVPAGERATAEQDEAILLIRAMIAAANADGRIDEEERAGVHKRLEEAGLTQEEQQFLAAELSNPCSIDSLLPQVGTEAMARQVYAASLLAVQVDTDAEREYLAYLARRLKLDEAVVQELRRQLGISPV